MSAKAELHTDASPQKGVQKMVNSPTRPTLEANRRGLDMRLQAPAPGPFLDVSPAEQDQQLGVLQVADDVDLATADHLQTQLHTLVHAGYRRLAVDLSRVGFCDSAGRGAILSGQQQAGASGGGFRLASPQPVVAKLLRISADTHDLPVDDAVEHATCRCGRLEGASICSSIVPSVDGW